VLYAVTQQMDADRGWGRASETWNTLAELKQMGGPDWFQLGDRDLALHLQRAAMLAEGRSMTDITAALGARLGLAGATRIMPATEQSIRTRVMTDQGEMAFQEYFVARGCKPCLIDIRYQGIEAASPNQALIEWVSGIGFQAFDVVLGPSNPFLSIAPILDIPGMALLLRERARRVVAISPIVGGRALKGPAAKIMTELGIPVSAAGWMQWVEQRYPGLVDTWVWDEQDRQAAPAATTPPVRLLTTNTVMSEASSAVLFADWLLEECLGCD
jgi:LPPG:FO 2-phospho-L-lactate transferase